MEINFVRHAQSTANIDKILQGHDNPLLSKNGEAQAKALGKKLSRKYDAIYSSSLNRAKDTAEIALQHHIVDPSTIILRDDLREMNLGLFQGMKQSEMNLDLKDMWNKLMNNLDFKEHNGESVNEFIGRSVNAFTTIVEEAKLNNYQLILIFTHGGVMRAILEHYLELTKGSSSFKNTELITIVKRYGKWKLIERIEPGL